MIDRMYFVSSVVENGDLVNPANPVQLLVPKHLALDDLVDDVFDRKIVVACSAENDVDLLAIGEFDLAARCIHDELRNEVAGDLFFLIEQESFELFDS